MSMYQNAAAIIAQRLKLTQEIPQKVLQETESALRLFKVKNPTGTFGKQDNDLKRACALLEYIYREMEGVKIPINRLAKAACMKEKDFLKFHQTIGNFRDNVAVRKAGRDASSGRKRSSIPSLGIKLGSYIQDSNGVASRAMKLFDDIVSHSKNMPASERAYQFRDMKQHQRAYEAACFYLVATSEKMITSRASKVQDEDDDRQLSISQVIGVSNDFTEADFKNILSHVENLCQDMKSGKGLPRQRETARQKGKLAGKKRSNVSTLEQRIPSKPKKSTGLLSQDLASNATLELLSRTNKNDEESAFSNDPIQEYEDPFHKMQGQKFMEWKEAIIARAIERAKKELDTDLKGSELDFIALDHAARQILERNGLIKDY